jgi:hypothetical protein
MNSSWVLWYQLDVHSDQLATHHDASAVGANQSPSKQTPDVLPRAHFWAIGMSDDALQ